MKCKQQCIVSRWIGISGALLKYCQSFQSVHRFAAYGIIAKYPLTKINVVVHYDYGENRIFRIQWQQRTDSPVGDSWRAAGVWQTQSAGPSAARAGGAGESVCKVCGAVPGLQNRQMRIVQVSNKSRNRMIHPQNGCSLLRMDMMQSEGAWPLAPHLPLRGFLSRRERKNTCGRLNRCQ